MERVLQYLERLEYRRALLRLWVLGSDPRRLGAWELQRRHSGEVVAQSEFKQLLADLDQGIAPSLERAMKAPLELIRAVDYFVASHSALTAPGSRSNNKTPPMEEDGKGYWLVPVDLKVRRNASLAKQLGNLSAWFRYHAVLPARTTTGLRVTRSFSVSSTDEGLHGLWQSGQPALKIWIGHFNDGADVVWRDDAIRTGSWRAIGVSPANVRQASVEGAVTAAVAAGAQVVVFPEFTLGLAQRRHLLLLMRRNTWPTLLLLLAGSFHEIVGGEAFNVARLYDGQGSEILVHRKLRLFGNVHEGSEDVSVGDAVHVLVTPIGCLTVLICKDFIDLAVSVVGLLTEVPVDWVLVPSFGDAKTIRAHKAKAKQIAVVTTGTHSVVAQTLKTAVPGEGPPLECVRGFGHAAGQPDPEPQVGETGGLVSFPLLRQNPPPAGQAEKPNAA